MENVNIQGFMGNLYDIYKKKKKLKVSLYCCWLLLNHISITFQAIQSISGNFGPFGSLRSIWARSIHFGLLHSTLVHLVHYGPFG